LEELHLFGFIKKNQNLAVILEDSVLKKERLGLKNYGFCKCLVLKNPKDSFFKNEGSLAGYIEIGSYSNDAYQMVDSFIYKKSQIKYRSKYKSPLYLMQCLDIYNSAEFDSVINKLDDKIDTNGIKW